MDGMTRGERRGRIENSTTKRTNNKNNAVNRAVKHKYKPRDIQRSRKLKVGAAYCTKGVHMSTCAWNLEGFSFYLFPYFSHQHKNKVNILIFEELFYMQ